MKCQASGSVFPRFSPNHKSLHIKIFYRAWTLFQYSQLPHKNSCDISRDIWYLFVLLQNFIYLFIYSTISRWTPFSVQRNPGWEYWCCFCWSRKNFRFPWEHRFFTETLIMLVNPRTFCGPGSSVSIETGYGLDGTGIESRWGRDFPHLSTPTLGPTQPPLQWVPGLTRG